MKPRWPPPRQSRRTSGRAKLIAALTKHHQYAEGGCLNLEPIGNNELAKGAVVSRSTASEFFKSELEQVEDPETSEAGETPNSESGEQTNP